MIEYYYIVWIYHILFNHSLIDKHLGFSHILTIANSAAMNISVQVFV